MKLVKIVVEVPAYGENKGKYVAKATCAPGMYGSEVTVDIADELLEPIVGLLTQAISITMTRAAEEFASGVAASLNPPVEHQAIEQK